LSRDNHSGQQTRGILLRYADWLYEKILGISWFFFAAQDLWYAVLTCEILLRIFRHGRQTHAPTQTPRLRHPDRRRTLATVMLDGIDVNLEQVKSGSAWVHEKYIDQADDTPKQAIAPRSKSGAGSGAIPRRRCRRGNSDTLLANRVRNYRAGESPSVLAQRSVEPD